MNASAQRALRLRARIDSPLKVVGLFAGIGGLEEGLHRAGHQTIRFCEIDEGARAVLAARFPEIDSVPDIGNLRSLPPSTDLVTAGFPCQNLSQAGQTEGIGGEQSGLVNEVFRLLERKRVPLVLLENVPFMLQLNKGKALEFIVSELERLGYKWAYRIVDSRAFGLPQRRRRVYLLASRDLDPRRVLLAQDAGAPEEDRDQLRLACGFYWTEGIRGLGWAVDAIPTLKGGSTIGIPSPPAIVYPDTNKKRPKLWRFVGKPDIRDAERLQGFEADWTLPAASVVRNSFRWRLVGNAVTVDAAKWIGTRLDDPLEYDPGADSRLDSGKPWPTAAWNVDGERFVSHVSEWPTQAQSPTLVEFLEHDLVPLSEKATRGFLSRTKRGGLRFPPGFIASLEAHLTRVAAGDFVAA